MLGLGIDIGTSGIRTAVLAADGTILSEAQVPHRPQSQGGIDARLWWRATQDCLTIQSRALRQLGRDPHEIRHAAIDATSGSMVLVDNRLNPVTSALMYDSSGFGVEARHIDIFAEETSITRGPNSALARLLHLQRQDKENRACHLLHQADFVLACFLDCAAGSDDNNTLKLGFDPVLRCWPHWFGAAGVRMDCLPDVKPAGALVGTIAPAVAQALDLSPELKFYAGTTDSVAAFLATGADRLGDAVTSLGTTLAIKILSNVRIEDSKRGIYSHRLGRNWLVGGASNTGGGVLAAYFSIEELSRLSAMIDPSLPSGLDYYPLLKPGERFPINDPTYPPRLSPRPAADQAYLHGMLEAMSRIEAEAYAALQELGAPSPVRIFTCGGGARNTTWTALRQQAVRAPFVHGVSVAACVGTARLALSSLQGV